MTIELKNEINNIIRHKTGLHTSVIIDVGAEIAEAVDKAMSRAVMEATSIGGMLEACGLEIRSKI